MEGCTYIWCKACQQEIVPNGPEHSCDGRGPVLKLIQEQAGNSGPIKFLYLHSGHHLMGNDILCERATRHARKIPGYNFSLCKWWDVTRGRKVMTDRSIFLHITVHFSRL